jgi:hypothetical protein
MGGVATTAMQTGAAPLISNAFDSGGSSPGTAAFAEGGIVVADLDGGRNAESKLRPLSEDATHIAEVAHETTYGELTWGVCAIYFEGEYKRVAGEMTEYIELCELALQGCADRIRDSIDDWESIDQEMQAAFEELTSQLED